MFYSVLLNISLPQLIKFSFLENVTSSSLETFYSNMTCWTDSFCYWMVPVGIFFGFILLGCVCGIIVGCLPDQNGKDEDEEDDLKENDTIK